MSAYYDRFYHPMVHLLGVANRPRFHSSHHVCAAVFACCRATAYNRVKNRASHFESREFIALKPRRTLTSFTFVCNFYRGDNLWRDEMGEVIYRCSFLFRRTRRSAEHSFVSALTANGAEWYLVSILPIVYTEMHCPPSFVSRNCEKRVRRKGIGRQHNGRIMVFACGVGWKTSSRFAQLPSRATYSSVCFSFLISGTKKSRFLFLNDFHTPMEF